MKNSMKKMLSNFVVLFFVVLITCNTIALVLLFDRITANSNEISLLQAHIASFEIQNAREETLSELKLIEFYKEISEKTNEATNRILTIVGIVTGIFTFFALLLAFKAPHDIDKRIDGLNQLVQDTKNSAEEAKYQALISSAMTKSSRFEIIRKLNEVIRKYPEKHDAYVERGFVYDDLKKYDLAIADYETAKKRGVELSSYYNSMGVAYSNKKNHRKAISYYTKAIKIDPDDSSFYCNRACAYDDLRQFENALEDYAKAIELDADCYEAYFNRNFTYDKLWRKETDKEKMIGYIQLRRDDLERAIELNPENDYAPKLLKKFVEELAAKEIIVTPEQMISQIDEKIADLSFEEGNMQEAYKYYLEAFDYHVKKMIVDDKENHQEDFERIGNKIIKLILSKNESDIVAMDENTNPHLISLISTAAYQNYLDGDKLNAEILFSIILSTGLSALNLAFMKRRGETKSVTENVNDLLERSENKASAIWCVNKALCYVDGVDNEVDWYKAINIVSQAEEDKESAIEWWSNISVVGEKESNVALLLMQFADVYQDGGISKSKRIDLAEKDGYIIPDDLRQ